MNTSEIEHQPVYRTSPKRDFARTVKGESEGDICMTASFERLRVLVADDDFLIASTLSQILRLSGFEAETASSGEEAVAVATKRAPDVFISDVVMGGITGIEAAIRVLEIAPNCLVILISGQAGTVDQLAESRRRGYKFEILSKPVHPNVLLDLIAAFARDRSSTKVHDLAQTSASY
jgi:DNA-binding NtrC family response regulator